MSSGSTLGGSHQETATITHFFDTAVMLLKQTATEWVEDKAPQLGAALAYYTVFSLAPLVLLICHSGAAIVPNKNDAGAPQVSVR